MKIFTTMMAAVFLSLAIGCGGVEKPDTTGVVPPPASTQDQQKAIENKMKEKGITPQNYGSPSSQPKDVPPP